MGNKMSEKKETDLTFFFAKPLISIICFSTSILFDIFSHLILSVE